MIRHCSFVIGGGKDGDRGGGRGGSSLDDCCVIVRCSFLFVSGSCCS